MSEHDTPEEAIKNQDFGKWSHPDKPPLKNPEPIVVSRRNFGKTVAAGIGGLVATGLAAKVGIDLNRRLESKENLYNPENTTIIDYFSGETEKETKDRLIADSQVNLDVLDDVDFSNFRPEEKDEIIQAIQVYKTTGSNDIVTRLILDKAIDIGPGNHGGFVREVYEQQSQGASNSQQPENVNVVGLQNFINNYQLEADALGNLVARINIDANLTSEHMQSEAVKGTTVNAFQFGEVVVRYDHTKIKDQRIGDAYGSDGKLYLFHYPPSEFNQNLLPVPQIDAEGNVYVDVNGQRAETRRFEGDEYDNEAVEIAIEQFRIDKEQQIYHQIQNGEILTEDIGKHTEHVDLADRVSYIEPYNNQENIDQYKQYCASNPEMMVVMAAGNNTDMRGLDIHTENGILVSGMGGNQANRKEMFDTDLSRNLGAAGAELYVLYEDFHDEDYPGNFVMTSSEATGLIGSYVKRLEDLGMNPNTIKQTLLNECSDRFEEGENRALIAGEGDFISGTVFSRQKAERFILTFNNGARN